MTYHKCEFLKENSDHPCSAQNLDKDCKKKRLKGVITITCYRLFSKDETN